MPRTPGRRTARGGPNDQTLHIVVEASAPTQAPAPEPAQQAPTKKTLPSSIPNRILRRRERELRNRDQRRAQLAMLQAWHPSRVNRLKLLFGLAALIIGALLLSKFAVMVASWSLWVTFTSLVVLISIASQVAAIIAGITLIRTREIIAQADEDQETDALKFWRSTWWIEALNWASVFILVHFYRHGIIMVAFLQQYDKLLLIATALLVGMRIVMKLRRGRSEGREGALAGRIVLYFLLAVALLAAVAVSFGLAMSHAQQPSSHAPTGRGAASAPAPAAPSSPVGGSTPSPASTLPPVVNTVDAVHFRAELHGSRPCSGPFVLVITGKGPGSRAYSVIAHGQKGYAAGQVAKGQVITINIPYADKTNGLVSVYDGNVGYSMTSRC